MSNPLAVQTLSGRAPSRQRCARVKLSFKHALIQQAAYESMLRSRRREIHAEIAEALLRACSRRSSKRRRTVATHLARAGDAAGAAEYWQRAGRLAQRNSPYREAIGAYIHEQTGPSICRGNRAVASVYFAAGEHQLNLKHLEEAVAAADASGDPVTMTEIAMQQCHVLSQFGGDPRQAVHVGHRALERANRLRMKPLPMACVSPWATPAGSAETTTA